MDFRFESLNIGFQLICQCLIKDEALNTDILCFFVLLFPARDFIALF